MPALTPSERLELEAWETTYQNPPRNAFSNAAIPGLSKALAGFTELQATLPAQSQLIQDTWALSLGETAEEQADTQSRLASIIALGQQLLAETLALYQLQPHLLPGLASWAQAQEEEAEE